MNPSPHEERALIDRLFRSGKVEPEDWDRLFAHLRAGCESCAAHYAARRSDAADGLGDAAPLTEAETNAITNVLIRRADAKASRSWSGRNWSSFVTVATVTCAALLMMRPWESEKLERSAPDPSAVSQAGPPSGGTKPSSQVRGVDDTEIGMQLTCMSSSPARGLAAVEAAGCPAQGPLLLESVFAPATGVKAVSMAVVDADLQLLDFRSSEARPGATVFVESVAERRGEQIQVFVFWSAGALERGTVEQALATLRRKDSRTEPRTLQVPGVLAQRAQTIAIRRQSED